MRTKDVNILIWDDPKNFELPQTQRSLTNNLYKKVYQFQSINDFKNILKELKDDDLLVVCCHINWKDFSGYLDFKNSSIEEEYSINKVIYLSSGDSAEAMKSLRKKENASESIIMYNELLKGIKADEIKPISKYELLNKSTPIPIENSLQCDYAVITALEENEMEKFRTIIVEEKEIPNEKYLIQYGHLKENKDIKIAYASQQQTGMIDAAIVSSDLILKFNPKYLIMLGVLGGKPDEVNIGDVVIATKVFTVDKGKIDKLGFHPEADSSDIIGAYITKIKSQKKEIERYVADKDETRNNEIKIHFGPIGCVGQVIDLEGYFEKKISKIDRKAVAIEMESYSIDRACKLVNNGNTKPLIIKGVMDNTREKTDDAKPYASYNSVMVLEYLLLNKIL